MSTAKFSMIPYIYAGDLSNDIRVELRNWDEEIYVALHYGTGVFTIRDGNDLSKLPKFIDWMVSIGAWTKEDVNLISFSEWRLHNNEGSYIEFEKYLAESGRKNRITFAMIGT